MADEVKKPWFTSKTIWVNVFSVVSLIAVRFFGWNLPIEAEGYFIAGVNIVLRFLTKQGIA
jgi:hypothetical protein